MSAKDRLTKALKKTRWWLEIVRLCVVGVQTVIDAALSWLERSEE